jgi:hypothetical protein
MSSSDNPADSPATAETPCEYLIVTNQGADLSAFENFIKTLPDRGQGHKIIRSHLQWQGYVTKMTPEQAKQAEAQPFILLVTPVLQRGLSETGSDM